MVPVQSVKKWLFPYLIALLFSVAILFNVRNLQLDQLYLDQLSANPSFVYFSNKVKTENPFSPDGLRFTYSETIDISLSGIVQGDPFSVKIKFIPKTLRAIHFRLWGTPHSVDLSLLETDFPFFKPDKIYVIEILRQGDRLKLLLQGKPIREENLSNHKFSKLQVETLKSEFSLVSVSALSEPDNEASHFSFAPSVGSRIKFSSLSLLLAAFFMLLAFIENRRYPKLTQFQCLGVVLFFYVPLWCGTLFLNSEKVNFTLFALTATSLIPLIVHWIAAKQLTANRAAPVILLVLICIGIFISISNNHGRLFGASAICIALGSILGVAGVYAKSRGVHFILGLTRFLPALAPSAFWIVFNATTEPEKQGLTAALVLSSTVMMTFLVFMYRKHLRGYTFWLLLFLGLCLAGTENFAQSSRSTLFTKQLTEKGEFVHDEKLFFVPAHLFSNGNSFTIEKIGFRSGKTNLSPDTDTFRILSLGGSNTWGDTIDSNDMTYSGRLESCLKKQYPDKKIEVINAGTKGYKLFQILQFYKNYCASYNPDLIVLSANTLDSEVNLGPYTIRELWGMKNEGNLQEIGHTSRKDKSDSGSAHWVISLQKIFGKSTLYNGLTKAISRQKAGPLKPLSERFGALKDTNPPEEYSAHLESIIQMARRNGSRIVLVDEFYATYVKNEDKKGAKIREIMEQTAMKYQVGFVGLNDEFGTRPDKMSLVFDYDKNHLNLKGHKEVSERICRFLIKNDYITAD